MRLNPEGVKRMFVYLVIAASIGLLIGLLFSLISPLAGGCIGSLWACVTFLALCCYACS